jgi:hypothetical protein
LDNVEPPLSVFQGLSIYLNKLKSWVNLLSTMFKYHGLSISKYSIRLKNFILWPSLHKIIVDRS